MTKARPVPTFLALLSTCVSVTPTAPPPPPPAFHDLTDPAAATAAVAALEGALRDSALLSYVVVAPILSITGGRVQFPAARLAGPTCAGVRPARAMLGATPARIGVVIPDSDLRRVYVYADATRRYVRGIDSSGPSDGIRFLLYVVDTIAQRPVLPLGVVGWMDLIDHSGPGAPDSLHGFVVGATTLVDYITSPTGTQTSNQQLVSGSITGGGHTFTFRDSIARQAEQVTAVGTFDDSATGARFALTAIRTVFDQFDNFYSLDFRFVQGSDTVGLQGTVDTYCQLSSTGLTVTANSGRFATVTNGPVANQPAITRSDSQPLSPAQETAVRDLIRGQGELFNLMTALAWPGALLLPP